MKERGKEYSMQDPLTVIDQRVHDAIEAVKGDTQRVLNIVEQNYRNYLEANITYHQYLMKLSAEENKNLQQYAHHKVMLETYQVMLDNLNSSKRFGSF
jgi:hypothetical protein